MTKSALWDPMGAEMQVLQTFFVPSLAPTLCLIHSFLKVVAFRFPQIRN